MDHGTMNSAPPAMSGATAAKHYTHMTFFWGKNSEILFTGWPGTRGGMYALALVVVFVLAVVLEFFTHCRALTSFPRSGSRRVAGGFVQTAGHAVRMGLAYLLMLAVMSFNGGVLIVVVAGHALGFLLFGSSLFRREVEADDVGGKGPHC